MEMNVAKESGSAGVGIALFWCFWRNLAPLNTPVVRIRAIFNFSHACYEDLIAASWTITGRPKPEDHCSRPETCRYSDKKEDLETLQTRFPPGSRRENASSCRRQSGHRVAPEGHM